GRRAPRPRRSPTRRRPRGRPPRARRARTRPPAGARPPPRRRLRAPRPGRARSRAGRALGLEEPAALEGAARGPGDVLRELEIVGRERALLCEEDDDEPRRLA